jgi:EAL domain-containing protein (putative c-di-GMP-specific phosphodiesterase class I)
MDDRFFLVYQPQIEMQTGRVQRRALLRWRDPSAASSARTNSSRWLRSRDDPALGTRCCATRAGRSCSGTGNIPLRLSVNIGAAVAARQLAVGRRGRCRAAVSPGTSTSITESVIITPQAVATLVS